MGKRSWEITENGMLLLAVGLSVLVRSTIFFLIYPDTEVLTITDQKIYLKLATHLRNTWDFGPDFGFERVPLYPIFVAFFQKISENLFFLIGIQNVFGLTSIFFLYKMGYLFSKRVAVLAAFFAAANINFAVLSNSVLTESIFYPLFCFFLLKLFLYSREKNVRQIALAGFILGLCTMIRHVTMFMPWAVCLYIFLLPGTKFFPKLRHAAVFFLLWAIAMAPWIYRNYEVAGYAGVTSQGEPHIIGWILPCVMQYEEKIDLKEAVKKSTKIWKEKKKKLPKNIEKNRFSLDREAKKFALDYILSCSVWSVTKAWFWGAMKNMFSPVTIELAYILKMDWTHFYETQGASFPEQAWNFIFRNKNRVYATLLMLGIVSMVVFRLLQAYGAWRMWKDSREIFVLSGLVILYFLLISGPVGYGKYRVPFEPVLILFTAIAFSGLLGRKKKRKTSMESKRAL